MAQQNLKDFLNSKAQESQAKPSLGEFINSKVEEYSNQNKALFLANNGLNDPAITSGDLRYDKLGRHDTGLVLGVDQNEVRGYNQSNWDKLGNGLARTASELTLGSLKAITDIPDTVVNLYKVATQQAPVFENDLSKLLGSAMEAIDENTPVHTPKAGQGFSPSSMSWWMNNLPSIASAATYIVPTMAATKATGKGISMMNKLARAAGMERELVGLVGQKVIPGLVGTIYSNAAESMAEAAPLAKQKYDEALEAGFSEEEATAIAAKVGKDIYIGNLANIILDLPSTFALMKSFKSSRNLLSSKSIGKAIGTEVIPEGLQESINYVSGQEATRNADISLGKEKDDKSYLVDRVIDKYLNDADMWTASFFGAIGGAVFQGVTNLKDKYDGTAKKEQQLRALQHQRTQEIGSLQNNKDLFEEGSRALLFEQAYESAKAGASESFISKLEEIQSYSDEEAAQFGIDKTKVQEKINESLEVEEIYNDVVSRFGRSDGEVDFNKIITQTLYDKKKLGQSLKDVSSKISIKRSELLKSFDFLMEEGITYEAINLPLVNEKLKSLGRQKAKNNSTLSDIKNNPTMREATKKKRLKDRKAIVKRLNQKIDDKIKQLHEEKSGIENRLAEIKDNTTGIKKALTTNELESKPEFDELKDLYNQESDILSALEVTDYNYRLATSKEGREVLLKQKAGNKEAEEENKIEDQKEKRNEEKKTKAKAEVEKAKVEVEKKIEEKEKAKTEEKPAKTPIVVEDIVYPEDMDEPSNTKKIVEVDKSINKPVSTDGAFEGLSTKERRKEQEDLKNSLFKSDERGNTLSPSGRVITLGDLIVNAASSIAYSSRDYETKYSFEKEGETYRKLENVNNDLSSTMKEPLLLSHKEFQVGEELILEVDKTFNIIHPKDGEITYRSIKDKELRDNKENLLVPIAIKTKKGKTIGYLHDIDWINTSNVASKDNNIERQEEELKKLRNAVAESGGRLGVKIIDKSYGKVAKNFEKGKNKKPLYRTVKEALPDKNLKIAIAKNSRLYTGVDEELVLGKDEELVNSPDFSYLNGGIYLILPSPVKGQNLAYRANTRKLTSEYVESIISVIDAFYNKNEELRDNLEATTGFNIFTVEGLRGYINTFTYTNSFDNKDVADALDKDSKKFLDISTAGIKFARGGRSINTIANKNDFKKLKESFKAHLEDSYAAIYLSKLEEDGAFDYVLIKNGSIEHKSTTSYKEFIKENTETDLNSYKLPNGEYAYFDQPVILINPTVPLENKVPRNFSVAKPTEEKKELKGIETEDGIVTISPSEEDEDYLPDLNENQEKKLQESLNLVLDTSRRQNAVVTFLAAQVINAIDDKAKSIEQIYQKYYDEFSKHKGNKQIDKILNNWPKLKKLSLTKVGKLRGIRFKEGFEVDGFEDVDSILDKTNFNDEGSLQIDPKDTISSRLRTFFTFIPIPERGYMGLIEYIEVDEVMNTISALLSNTAPSYSVMYSKLKQAEESKPWITNLLTKLDNASDQIKKEFVVYASKHHANMKTVLHKRDRSGNVSLKVIDTDQNSLVKSIKEEWMDNLRQSSIVENSPTLPGEQMITKEARESLSAEFENLAKNPTKEGLKAWIEKFGVKLSDKSLDVIVNNSKDVKGLRGLEFSKLFTDTNGAFKILNDKLKNEAVEDGEENLLLLNNPLVDNSGINALARIEAEHTDLYYSNSFKDGENKTIYGYTLNKYFSNKFRELKENKQLVSDLLGVNFNSTSIWLKGLSKEGYFKDTFDFFYIDSIKEQAKFKKTKGVKLKNQSSREHEITKISLFQNQGNVRESGGKVQRLTNFLYTTMADKTNMLGISTIGHDTKILSNGDLHPDTIKTLFRIVEAEHKRIARFQELKKEGKEPKIDGYSIGAEKFIFFPFLNNADALWAGKELLPLGDTQIEYLKKYLNDTVKDLAREKIGEWKSLGVITEAKKGLILNYLDATYINKIVNPKIENKNNTERAKYAATDYVVNYLIANTNFFQTFIGDPAMFWKKNMDDTWVNIGKRLAKEIAPGLDIPDSDSNEYKQVFLTDKKSVSSNIEYLEKILGKEGAEEYRDIEGTDAQELTILQEHLYVMKQMGKISEDQYKEFLSKGNRGVLSLRELAIVLQPMKPVYVDNKLDLEGDVNRVIYIKSSSFPLIPQLTKGLEIDKLRRAMENAEGGPIARAAFKSATKVGGTDFINIWEGKNIKDNLVLDKFTVLSRKGFRIQQEVPFDENKKSIIKGSQETKLLFNNIQHIDEIKKLKSKYESLHKELYKNHYNKLLEEVINNGEVDVKKIQSILKEEGVSRDYSLNELQALDLDENNEFKFPLWASASASRFESLLNSIVDNRVRKKKMPGFSGVLATEDGFIGKSIGNDIVWVEGYNTEEGLKGNQILVPFKFRDNKGKLINLSKFTIEKDGKKYLNTEKIDKDILKLFGYRIPTQGHNSMASLEIVGFLPYELGDLVIPSRDLTKQMGSDFDIDKLYLYQYNTYLTDDNKLTKYITEDNSDEVIQNKIIDIHHDVMNNPHEDIQKQIYQALGFGKLKELANKYNQGEDFVTILSDKYQKHKYINGTAGKAGVGVFSLDSTFNASIQGKDINLIGDPLVFGDENNNPIKGNELNDPYTKTDKNRTKSDVISAYQSAAVDNEKEQILDKLNINTYTFDAIRAFNQSGFEEDFVSRLLTLPIIKEYAEEMKRTSDSLTEEYIADVENEVSNKLRKRYIEEGTSSEADIEKYMNPDYPLSIKEMDSQKPIIQLSALLKFQKATKIGKDIQKIQSAINTDSKGLGASLFETHYKEDQIAALIDNESVRNAFLLLGESDKFGNLVESTTINGFATEFALMTNNELWSRFFPYNSLGVVQAFKEIETIYGKPLTADNKREIWNHIKSYTYAKVFASIEGKKLESERERLFFNTQEENQSNKIAKEYTNYSGGALGSDIEWETIGKEFGLGKQVNYIPNNLNSLTKEQRKEVEDAYQKAVKDLGRRPLQYNWDNPQKEDYSGGLVRRDYLQAKAADSIYAISSIIEPNQTDKKGYKNKTFKSVVEGGTGYAVQMAINLGKPVFVFDQNKNEWFKVKYREDLYGNKEFESFILTTTPKLTKKFSGIGTRELSETGKKAIKDVYENTFGNINITKKSLAARIKELKETKIGKNNAFVKRLRTEIHTDGVNPSLVKFNAAAGENLDELNIYQGFVDLIVNPETKEIAKDLVIAAYLAGGIQQANQYIKYIPVEYLNQIGLSGNLRSIDFNRAATLGNVEQERYYDLSDFTTQYFQHNSYRLPEVTLEDIDTKEKAIPSTFSLNKEVKNISLLGERYVPSAKKKVANLPVEFVKSGDRIFKYLGNKTYQEISPLGKKDLMEYSPSNTIIASTTKDKTIEEQIEKEYTNPLVTDSLVDSLGLPKNGTLTKGILLNVEQSNNNLYSELSTQLIKRFDLFDNVGIVLDRTLKAKGSYSNSKNTITINPDKVIDKLDLEKTLLHEVLHAGLNKILNNPTTKEQISIVSSLETLRSVVADKIKNDAKLNNDINKYATSNVREFVNMVMTEPEFQRVLNAIPFTGNRYSLWQRFTDLINKLLNSFGFNIEKGSVLESAVQDVVSLMNSMTIAENIESNLYEGEMSIELKTQVKAEIQRLLDSKEIIKDCNS